MKYLNALKEEILINFEETWSYKMSFISETVVIAILYISLLLFDAGTSLGNYYGIDNSSKELLLAGYIMYSFSIMCINIVSDTISAEATKGTLELKFMSQIPFYVLMIGRLITSTIISAIEICLIIIISTIFFNVSIHISLSFIIILLINMCGMYGIGIILGGIALKEKKIGKVVYILQIILLFISNTIYIMSNQLHINNIIPLTISNDLVRKLISMNNLDIRELIVLSIISVIWLIVGIFIFKLYENRTKKDGVLSTY